MIWSWSSADMGLRRTIAAHGSTQRAQVLRYGGVWEPVIIAIFGEPSRDGETASRRHPPTACSWSAFDETELLVFAVQLNSASLP